MVVSKKKKINNDIQCIFLDMKGKTKKGRGKKDLGEDDDLLATLNKGR